MAAFIALVSTLAWTTPRQAATFSIDIPDAWVQRSGSVLGAITYQSIATREMLSVFVFEIEPDRVSAVNDQVQFEAMVQRERDNAAKESASPAMTEVTQPVFSPKQGYYMLYRPRDDQRMFIMWSVNTKRLSVFRYEAIGHTEAEFATQARSLSGTLKVRED